MKLICTSWAIISLGEDKQLDLSSCFLFLKLLVFRIDFIQANILFSNPLPFFSCLTCEGGRYNIQMLVKYMHLPMWIIYYNLILAYI